jgi:hypothetical protein
VVELNTFSLCVVDSQCVRKQTRSNDLRFIDKLCFLIVEPDVTYVNGVFELDERRNVCILT